MTIEELMTDVTSQLDKLNALGTVEQIRDYFIAEQITGCRRQGQNCPVFNYLVRELGMELDTPGDPGVAVGPAYVQIGSLDASYPHHCVDHPETVRKFVEHFDGGCFNELVTPMDFM